MASNIGRPGRGGEPAEDLRLTRAKFLEHFANRSPCLIGMEACGGAQHWARRLLTPEPHSPPTSGDPAL